MLCGPVQVVLGGSKTCRRVGGAALLLAAGCLLLSRPAPSPRPLLQPPTPGPADSLGEQRAGWDDYTAEVVRRCGQLCNTSAARLKPGPFLGAVTARVDCPSLMSLFQLAPLTRAAPPTLHQISDAYRTQLSHGGRVRLTERYINDAVLGGAKAVPTVFTQQEVEQYVARARAGRPYDPSYPGAANLVAEAAGEVNVTGRRVLVIGSQTPWVEAVLLMKGARQVVTLEYGLFHSEHPAWEILRPAEFHQRYKTGSLGQFEAVFTYSSVEHSGLGRYGDSLNPWGDIIAVGQAWCVASPGAKLALAVPTSVHSGEDVIEYNAHRVYGPGLYPFLATNWQFSWPMEDIKRNGNGPLYQPIFIFKKV